MLRYWRAYLYLYNFYLTLLVFNFTVTWSVKQEYAWKKFRILVIGFWVRRHRFIASNCWTFITFITAVKPVGVVNVLMMTLWLCHRSVWVTGFSCGDGLWKQSLAHRTRIPEAVLQKPEPQCRHQRVEGLITRKKWHGAKDPEDYFPSGCRNKAQRSDGTDGPCRQEEKLASISNKTFSKSESHEKNVNKDERALKN